MKDYPEVPIVKTKKKKKKKPKDKKHGKKIIWNDKESKVPLIILDECIYSPELQQKVAGMGYNVAFLGSGLSDGQIRTYMIKNQNTVLITIDVEFDSWFEWKRSLLLFKNKSINEMSRLINEFMWIHKQ